MEPTPEQLEAVALAVAKIQGSAGSDSVIEEDRVIARAAWDIVAPMVLEAAAALCEDVGGYYFREVGENPRSAGATSCAERIRALKANS